MSTQRTSSGTVAQPPRDRRRSGRPVVRGSQLTSSPRMFRSDLLEFFSRVHPAAPVLIFGPAVAILAYSGLAETRSPLAAVGLLAGGYVFWTLCEYWIHRAIFHFEPERGIGARLHWIIHGVHHDYPNDPKRLVMPPAVSVPLAILFWLGFEGLLGRPAAYLFGAGFFGGYLLYDMIHYSVHHHRPRTRVMRLLRELHMRHHFQDATRGYGISAPWWDVVFGTLPRRQGRARAAGHARS